MAVAERVLVVLNSIFTKRTRARELQAEQDLSRSL